MGFDPGCVYLKERGGSYSLAGTLRGDHLAGSNAKEIDKQHLPRLNIVVLNGSWRKSF